MEQNKMYKNRPTCTWTNVFDKIGNIIQYRNTFSIDLVVLKQLHIMCKENSNVNIKVKAKIDNFHVEKIEEKVSVILR